MPSRQLDPHVPRTGLHSGQQGMAPKRKDREKEKKKEGEEKKEGAASTARDIRESDGGHKAPAVGSPQSDGGGTARPEVFLV